MVAAIRIHKHGGPEVLTYEDIPAKEPGQGEVRIKQSAIGFNFIDVYFRSGAYPAPGGLPVVIGNEGAGVVAAVGPGVSELKLGDRVAYYGPLGAYAAERNVPADRVLKLPKGIDEKTAAGMMLKGMTAEYLLRRTFKVEKGHTVLVHAAAGGVGTILSQWANHLGATVIGTVGSKDKAEVAKKNGCHHTILYRDEDFAARVGEITKGAKCNVVYDGVGKATFPGSLDCLKPRGYFVSFGASSGQIDAFNIGLLQQKGSLYATRPTLQTYSAKREDLVSIANSLFDVVSKGAVKIAINQTYALKDAAQAHRDLEARKTMGSTILLP
ncbi:MAG: quinone oxidoreductase [Xanthobacteraceae bacterium]|nr:quinone oxidoreductase [Xanthobacteraceae bacterium]